VPQGADRSSKTVGVQAGIRAGKHLITEAGVKAGIRANADGDPAADGMQVSKTVGRCNVEREAVLTVKRIFKE
jgi:hypothetical protein